MHLNTTLLAWKMCTIQRICAWHMLQHPSKNVIIKFASSTRPCQKIILTKRVAKTPASVSVCFCWWQRRAEHHLSVFVSHRCIAKIAFIAIPLVVLHILNFNRHVARKCVDAGVQNVCTKRCDDLTCCATWTLSEAK